MTLFAVLFFPGVLLHEGSHFVAARLLGVRTGNFSLIPRVVADSPGRLGSLAGEQGGRAGKKKGEAARLQLGYVETARADLVRDALIGAAPLVSGGLFITYAGLYRLGFHLVWNDLATFRLGAVLAGLVSRPDFWVWFYLIFAVSSTMLPSTSDRRAWLPLAGILALLVGAFVLAGAGPWLAANLAPLLNRALHAMAMVLGISVMVHLVLVLPFWALHRVLSRLTGLRVV